MRRTSSLYAHQAINLSTGGQYSLNHFGTSTVCFLWSFHVSLASKPLKTVWAGHNALQRIVSQNNQQQAGSQYVQMKTSTPAHQSSPTRVFLKSGNNARLLPYFWLKRWSEKVHRSILQATLNNNTFLFVFFLPHSRKKRCCVCQTAIQ